MAVDLVFLAKTSTTRDWKVVSSVVLALVDEATFEASLEGITFRAMDPSHVALVDLSWPSSTFEKYECDSPFKFSVKMDDFAKLIKRGDTKDSIEIATTDDENIMLRILNGYEREFLLHLIESTYSSTPLPKLTFNLKAVIAKRAFESMLNDISVISDHVTIDSSNDKLVFYGKGDIGSGSVILEKTSEDILELEVKENSKATYNIEYLSSIIKASSSASDIVILEYSSKMPIRLELKLSDLGGKIHFYLAPRIEEK